MPVKIWNREGATLTTSVETTRKDSFRGERYRSDAEALDREIDSMLDTAAELSEKTPAEASDQKTFVKRWAVGRALMESKLLQSPHLDADEMRWLWLAIARKCRIGVRANGDAEGAWRELIPNRATDPSRIERDVFAVSLWLQEQEIEAAMLAFGGKFGNAQKFHNRKAIRALNLREALARWMEHQPSEIRTCLSNIRWFAGVMKALATRFPDRGPGSAKRPGHYSDEDLYLEVLKTLDPVAAELARNEECLAPSEG